MVVSSEVSDLSDCPCVCRGAIKPCVGKGWRSSELRALLTARFEGCGALLSSIVSDDTDARERGGGLGRHNGQKLEQQSVIFFLLGTESWFSALLTGIDPLGHWTMVRFSG